ncbi:hypothetical protein F4678DRAFT_466439 [Xylaria arbuscula]|nr:hypothetical protein F4678DRAFT_466439 [Xylaria arbuscula]
MSGFEVAGVVLGAIPLVISALEHYKAGKGVAATFFKWRDQLDTLICRLKLQQCLLYFHLLELLRDAGVEDAIEEDLTEERCLQILKDSKNEEVVRAYLGAVPYSMFLEVLRRYEACLTTLAVKLGHIHRPTGTDDLVSILAVNDIQSLAFKKRVRFTIERTVLGDLVEELREDRLSLQSIIQAIHTQAERTQRQLSYEATSLQRTFDKVRETVIPLFNAICKGCTCDCSKHYIRMKLPGCKSIEALKRRRTEAGVKFDLMLDQGGQFHQTIVTARQTSIGSTEVIPQRKQRSGKNVQFPSSVMTIVNEPQPSSGNHLQDKIVTDLCEALCEAKISSRVLRLELVNHNLLYDYVEPVQGTYTRHPPSEFLDLFLRKNYQNYDLRMTPKQQTYLALDVASSVLQLRQTCWLDADFRSTSIRILLYDYEGQGTLSPALYVERIVHASKTLDYTKMAPWPEPKTTLLELAIMLLEIWHHQPLDACINWLGLDCIDTLETRRIAAIRWLERTSSHLPLHHLHAVEYCLAICSGRLRSWADKEFLKEYCENIIKPLQESCKAW